jgi:hypothetical protein
LETVLRSAVPTMGSPSTPPAVYPSPPAPGGTAGTTLGKVLLAGLTSAPVQ